MNFWEYKCNIEGGPAGFCGVWDTMVFHTATETEWGGHYSTISPQVKFDINFRLRVGDVIVAYQTDKKVVVGFCVVTKLIGKLDDVKIYLKPIHRLATPFPIHQRKSGTILESSWTVRGPVMLAELTLLEMKELVRLTGAPKEVLKGQAPGGRYRPVKSLPRR